MLRGQLAGVIPESKRRIYCLLAPRSAEPLAFHQTCIAHTWSHASKSVSYNNMAEETHPGLLAAATGANFTAWQLQEGPGPRRHNSTRLCIDYYRH